MSAAERRRGADAERAVVSRNIFGFWSWIVPGVARGTWRVTEAEARLDAMWHGFEVDGEDE